MRLSTDNRHPSLFLVLVYSLNILTIIFIFELPTLLMNLLNFHNNKRQAKNGYKPSNCITLKCYEIILQKYMLNL